MSRKAVLASSNETPCFTKFRWAFRESHSNINDIQFSTFTWSYSRFSNRINLLIVNHHHTRVLQYLLRVLNLFHIDEQDRAPALFNDAAVGVLVVLARARQQRQRFTRPAEPAGAGGIKLTKA